MRLSAVSLFGRNPTRQESFLTRVFSKAPPQGSQNSVGPFLTRSPYPLQSSISSGLLDSQAGLQGPGHWQQGVTGASRKAMKWQRKARPARGTRSGLCYGLSLPVSPSLGFSLLHPRSPLSFKQLRHKVAENTKLKQQCRKLSIINTCSLLYPQPAEKTPSSIISQSMMTKFFS